MDAFFVGWLCRINLLLRHSHEDTMGCNTLEFIMVPYITDLKGGLDGLVLLSAWKIKYLTRRQSKVKEGRWLTQNTTGQFTL